MSAKDLNIVFAGTPDFAAIHLSALIKAGLNVSAVYTQPDRPAGRGKKLTPSAVKKVALEHDIPVYQPLNFKEQADRQQLADLKCDIMVVVAYGLLLPKAVLDLPKLGCINVHGSILPRWRGAAPIQRAIEAGDTESGVTIMQMDVGLDTGDMLLKATCPILPIDSSLNLHDRLAEIGQPALLQTLENLANGTVIAKKQDDSLSNYAKKIEKSEALINWQESSETIDRKIRAFNPFPIMYTHLGKERFKVHSCQIPDDISDTNTNNVAPGSIVLDNADKLLVKTGDGLIELTKVQLPGKKAMDSDVFLNGFSNLLENSPQLTTQPAV